MQSFIFVVKISNPFKLLLWNVEIKALRPIKKKKLLGKQLTLSMTMFFSGLTLKSTPSL